MRSLAPAVLLDRDDELAELADFCLKEEDQDWYAWWRAPAWAGKSALLSWFVLHPPPGVTIVSFFVTARLPGQNDAVAFREVVSEQLAEILGQPMPDTARTTFVAHMLAMLDEAALECAKRNQKLVLVVDGLDEDAGAAPGPNNHSIATLLPARPAAGLKVIVSGRLDRPVPWDVADEHPLHDTGVMRRLRTSRHATVVREAAERDLRRLCFGDHVQRAVLGVLTATNGGLSARDIAEVSSLPEEQIELCLRGTLGRAVSTIPASGQTPIFVFAHGELQPTAARLLGEDRVADHRQHVHAWAERYRQRRWPAKTPEYLLSGYFHLLKNLGDDSRLIEYVTDRARHDRMVRHFGADATALEEITDAQDVIASDDLLGAARLAFHRDAIYFKNTDLPAGLPEVWYALGDWSRAEALARSGRPGSLISLVKAAIAAGEPERVDALNQHSNPHLVFYGLGADDTKGRMEIVRSLAAAGDFDRAEAFARTTSDAPSIAAALGHTARVAFEHGERQRASRLADEIQAMAEAADSEDRRRAVLGSLYQLRFSLGAAEEADRLGARLEALAARSPTLESRIDALTEIVRAAARTGDRARVTRLAREIEDLSWDIDYPLIIRTLLEAVVEGGDHDLAESLARGASDVDDPDRASDLLTEYAWIIARNGGVRNAESLLSLIDRPEQRERVISAMVGAKIRAGAHDDAIALARAIPDPHSRASCLVSVARDLADREDLTAAVHLVDEIENLADSLPTTNERTGISLGLAALASQALPRDRAERLLRTAERRCEVGGADAVGDYELRCSVLIRAWNEFGDTQKAESLVETMSYAPAQALALTDLARAAIASGDRQRATRLARRAESVARGGTNDIRHDDDMLALAQAVAVTGDSGRAIAVADRILDDDRRISALAAVSMTLVEHEHREAALTVAGEVVAATRRLAGDARDRALVPVLYVLARCGHFDRALELTDTVSGQSQRDRSFANLAYASLEGCLDHPDGFDRARAMARSISDPSERATVFAEMTMGVVEVGSVDDLPGLVTEARFMVDHASGAATRCLALTMVMTALRQAGRHAEAAEVEREIKALIERTDYLHERIECWCALARSLAHTGRRDLAVAILDPAMEFARARPERRERHSGMGPIAIAFAEVGEAERAENYYRSLPTGSRPPVELVAAVAAARVRKGDVSGAESLVDELREPRERAGCLTYLADQVEPRAARQLCARALRLSPWTTPLATLARIAPDVVISIADEVLSYGYG